MSSCVARCRSIVSKMRDLARPLQQIEQIEIGGQDAILVTLFIPQEGAAGVEAGQLIYYR